MISEKEYNDWIHELENSDNYRQIYGQLVSSHKQGKFGDYCALGILGKVLNILPVNKAFLPFNIVPSELQHYVIILNDEKKLSFKQIARYLKKQKYLYYPKNWLHRLLIKYKEL